MRSISFKGVFIWVLRILLAALFLATALFKLSGQPMMVAEFQTIGLGQWFRYFTGAVELLGAITVVVPRFSPWGALLLLGVALGAFFTQALVLHGDIIHTIVIGGTVSLLILLQSDRFSRPAST